MLDFGWPELIVIAAIVVFVIGPDDIPKIMQGVGRLFRRFQYMRYAVSQQFESALEAGDIDELRKSVNFEAKDSESFDEAEADEDIVEEGESDEPKPPTA